MKFQDLSDCYKDLNIKQEHINCDEISLDPVKVEAPNPAIGQTETQIGLTEEEKARLKAWETELNNFDETFITNTSKNLP